MWGSQPASGVIVSLSMISRLANKRLSLFFWGVFLGDLFALILENWSTIHLSAARATVSPLRATLLIGTAVLAVLFQPDKTIAPSAKGIGIGRAPLDSTRDCVAFAIYAA